MSVYVGKCSTLSAHICRIGASKCPSMGRFLDSSYVAVAYLRVLVWDPCCSSFFKVIERHLSQVRCFVDDTQLYPSFRADDDNAKDVALRAMEECVRD